MIWRRRARVRFSASTGVTPDPKRSAGLFVRAGAGVAVSFTVSLSAITIGAVLSTALLIGPAATALRLASRPGIVLLLAPFAGLIATFGGILLAYDSYGWGGGHGWPVSFCIVALVLTLYLLASLVSRFGIGLKVLDIEA